MGNKKTKSDYKWEAKAVTRYGVKVRNDSGIPAMLKQITAKQGKSINSYIIEAITEKLGREK